MVEIFDELKALFFRNGITVFGTADAKHLESEPEGYRPSDLLPAASTMLCFGIPIPKGMLLTPKRVSWSYWRMANFYYQKLDMISSQAAVLVEEKNESAAPIFSCFPVELKGPGDFLGTLSLVRMAEKAGLGKIGKNGLLFHSAYGSRLMLGGIVTTASLPEFSWPQKDETGCPKDCFVCQDICPAKAIDRSGKVNRPACIKYSMQSPLFALMMKSGDIDHKMISTIFNTANVDGNAVYTCTKCVSECPKSINTASA